MEPTRYKKMSGFATTKGQMFEVKLSALLFLRGINSGLEFQLASNVAGAGALDDVVFRIASEQSAGKWTTCFVQLKHKENSRISCKMLTDPKGNFSLQKYCESYIEIKQAMSLEDNRVLFDGRIEDCTIVIYSNAKANKDLGLGRLADSSLIESFLESGSGSIISFEQNRDTDVDKAVFGCLQKYGDDGSDFLRQLRVFCGQPNESELNSLIKDELHKLNDKTICDVEAERLCECFLENVSVWCERSDFVLHRGSDLLVRARDRVIVETCSAADKGKYRLDVSFEETTLLPLRDVLNDKSSLVFVESCESSSRLSVTKLLQAVQGSYLFLNYRSLKVHSSSVTSEWKLNRYATLILATADPDLTLIDDGYLALFLELSNVAVTSGKKIVILSHETASLAEKLVVIAENRTARIEDTFEFSQIAVESRNKFLCTRFSFQGHEVTLESFVDDRRDVLTAADFVDVATGGLSIGSEFADAIGYYVARTLTQTTTLTADLFRRPRLEESFLVTYGAAQDVHCVLRQGDDSAANRLRVDKTLEKVAHVPLIRGGGDGVYFGGEEVKFGEFASSRVGLRHGLPDQVTALRVRPRSQVDTSNAFVFVREPLAQSDAVALLRCRERHALALADGTLAWIASRADSMDVIRQHVDHGRVEEVVTEIVTDMKERLVLLCAEPGMGKSTLLSRYAKKTKQALPHYWVVLIALNDHTRLFADKEHRDAVGFLVSAIGIESRLQRSMFSFALNVTGNVVVLLDGFDEIAPTYVPECRLLLSNLLATKAKKIWITSRNSIKSTLEDHLATLAAKLRKFTVADQRLFFKLYWRAEREEALAAGREIIGDDALDEFVGKLIEMTSSAISDREKDFMSIPLQTRMMAEVFADHVLGSSTKCVLPEKLDLLQLLDHFIEKKLRIYVRDKLKVNAADTNFYVHLDIHRRVYVQSHMEAGLVLILGEEDIGKLHARSILANSVAFFEKIGRGEDKTGIIDCVVNGKPRFIHRVFAEYFVARWFAEHFADNAAYLVEHLYTPAFRVVRDIFDRLLAANLPLHSAVLDENLDAVRTARPNDERDRGRRTALHLAAALGTDDERQLAIVQALIGRSEETSLDDSISGVDIDAIDSVFGATPLWYADATGSYGAVDALLRYGAERGARKPLETAGNRCRMPTKTRQGLPHRSLESEQIETTAVARREPLRKTLDLVRDEAAVGLAVTRDLDRLLALWLDNGLGVEYVSESRHLAYTSDPRLLTAACAAGSVRVARLLTERGANVGCTKQREEPPLHTACKTGNVALVRLLCEAGERSDLTQRVSWLAALRNLVTTKPFSARKTIVGTQRDSWSAFAWRLFVAMFSRKIAGSARFIDAADRSVVSETALHIAVQENHAEVVRFLIGRGAELRSRGLRGKTPLHSAAWRGREDIVAAILDSIDEEKRLELLNILDNFGNTPLHHAATNLATLRILVAAGGDLSRTDDTGRTALMIAAENGAMDAVAFVVGEFEADAVQKANHLNARAKSGDAAIHFAAKGGSKKMVSFLIAQGADLRSIGHRGQTPLHVAAANGETAVVRLLLDAVSERERASYANAVCDSYNGKTALVSAIRSGRLELVDVLVKAGADVGVVDSDGKTALMFAAAIGYLDIVDYILRTFDDNSQPAAKSGYVNLSSEKEGTALHSAVVNDRADVAESLIANGADVTIRAGWQKRSALHIAVADRRTGLVPTLLSAVADSERAAFVDAVDADGDTSLHCAVLKSPECVLLLVEAGAALTAQNGDGETALTLAACVGNGRAVGLLLDACRADAEGVSMLQYVEMRGSKGRTALDVARERGDKAAVARIEDALRREGFEPVRRRRWSTCVLS